MMSQPLFDLIASPHGNAWHQCAPWLLVPATLLLFYVLIDTMIERGDTIRFKAAWQAFRTPPKSLELE